MPSQPVGTHASQDANGQQLKPQHAGGADEGEKSKDDETEKEESDEQEEQNQNPAFMPFPHQAGPNGPGGLPNGQDNGENGANMQQQMFPGLKSRFPGQGGSHLQGGNEAQRSQDEKAPTSQFNDTQRLNSVAMGLQPGTQGQAMQLANAAGIQGHGDGSQHQVMNQGFPGQPSQQAMPQNPDGKVGEKAQPMPFAPPTGLGDLAGKFATAS